ncbi:MAG: protein TonB [Crocinitomicaceae bacterium]|jgi:protein TonB
MELKKGKEANIDRVRVPIILLGLLFSGSLVLASFSYETLDSDGNMENKDALATQLDYQQEEMDTPEPEDVPEQEQIDVPPPLHDDILELDNKDVPPVPDIDRPLPPPIPIGPPVPPVPPIEVVEFPDVDAGFPGGVNAMKKWIQEIVVYPELSMRIGDQGKVYLSFVVEADGSVTNIKVERKVSPELDTEAKRVVRKMPKWVPGEVKGRAVRTRCRLPITFTITG